MQWFNIRATTVRVLVQLKNDKPTLACIFVIPVFLEVTLRLIYSGNDTMFNLWGVPLLWIFPFIVMFVVTSITTLRERTSGTLDRIMTMPTNKYEFILGYALAFSLISTLQSLLVTAIMLGPLNLTVRANVIVVLGTAVIIGLLGTSLGLFVSAFAKNEFQAVQLMPAVVMPQLLICGLLVPRHEMPSFLDFISNVMPLTYATDAMNHLARTSSLTWQYWHNLLLIVVIVFLVLLMGALTIGHSSLQDISKRRHHMVHAITSRKMDYRKGTKKATQLWLKIKVLLPARS